MFPSCPPPPKPEPTPLVWVLNVEPFYFDGCTLNNFKLGTYDSTQGVLARSPNWASRPNIQPPIPLSGIHLRVFSKKHPWLAPIPDELVAFGLTVLVGASGGSGSFLVSDPLPPPNPIPPQPR